MPFEINIFPCLNQIVFIFFSFRVDFLRWIGFDSRIFHLDFWFLKILIAKVIPINI